MSKDTTATIHRMLAERYSGSDWAYLTEAPDGTGMKKQRTADAIAIGLWSKNAGQFHGFEVKSSRSDWTRELQEPEKSRSWRDVVTSFWLVAGRGVAKLQEVPPDWGFLEVSTNGESLKIRKQPVHVARASVPLNVVGAILRRGVDQIPFDARKKLDDVNAAVNASYRSGRDIERRESARLSERNEHLEQILRKLHGILGKSPESVTNDDFVAMLIKAVHTTGLSHLGTSLSAVHSRLVDWRVLVDRLDDRLLAAIAEFDRIGDTVQGGGSQ